MSEHQIGIVLNLLAEISGNPREQITEDMNLIADLDIDLPDALRLRVEIEDALGLEISDDNAAAMNTVGDLLGYIRAQAVR